MTARPEIPSPGSWGLIYGRAGVSEFMAEGVTEYTSSDRHKISGADVRKLAACLLVLRCCLSESLDFNIRDCSTSSFDYTTNVRTLPQPLVGK